jgi:hypothetical protein
MQHPPLLPNPIIGYRAAAGRGVPGAHGGSRYRAGPVARLLVSRHTRGRAACTGNYGRGRVGNGQRAPCEDRRDGPDTVDAGAREQPSIERGLRGLPTRLELDPNEGVVYYFMFIRPQPYTCLGTECG